MIHQDTEQLKMASLCQICGVTGFGVLLEYCKKCRTSAQHRYCFPKVLRRDEKVMWSCELCEPTIEKLAPTSGRREWVSFRESQNGDTPRSQKEALEGMRGQCGSPEQINGRKMKKRRRLIIDDDDQSDHEAKYGSSDQGVGDKVMKLPAKPAMALSPQCTNSPEVTIRSRVAASEPPVTPSTGKKEASDDQNPQQHARPIYEHMWWGCLSFGDEKFGPLTAHLSTLACQRVYDAAKALPSVLHMEKHSRLDSLPNSLKNSPPRGDKIGLFFLPSSTMSEHVVDQLLAEVIREDLLLKCVLDEVELLVLPSTILPKESHRIREKYYLWGAFRLRQVPIPSSIAATEVAKEENQRVDESEEGEICKKHESSCDGSRLACSPHSVLQQPESNELIEETRKPGVLSMHAVEKGAVEAGDVDVPQEREESEFWDRQEKGEGAVGDKRRIYDDFSDGHIVPLFPHAAEKKVIASEVGGGQAIEVESHSESPQELDIGRQEAMQRHAYLDELSCLPLFTLVSEDLGVVDRGIDHRRELNLDLCL